MPDYFALLDEPRRPWIDPESLKNKFYALSADGHPDRVHEASEAVRSAANQRYVEINSAYNCLRDPKERLHHLLELEQGSKPKPIERVPDDAADLFFQVGQLCRAVDQFLAEKSKVTSPLLRVETFERAMEWTERLNALQQHLTGKQQHLLDELKSMNAHWDRAREIDAPMRREALALPRLEEIYRALGYLTRWSAQLQERVVQLSF